MEDRAQPARGVRALGVVDRRLGVALEHARAHRVRSEREPVGVAQRPAAPPLLLDRGPAARRELVELCDQLVLHG